MARKGLFVAFSIAVAASPALATNPAPNPPMPAPTDSADARYCMRVEPLTGSLIETTKCWTRAEWTEQGVDVDKEWSREGVAVIHPRS